MKFSIFRKPVSPRARNARVLCALLLSAFSARAAVPRNTLQQPPNILVSRAGQVQSVQGGAAGRFTSLLDLRTSASKNGSLERIVVDIGDEMKRKLVGRVGYYTVEMRPQQIVVSFRQTLNSAFSDKALMGRLQKSPYVAKSRLHFEPLSQTTNLILDLKKTAKLHVYSVSGSRQTGKVILDFSPAVL